MPQRLLRLLSRIRSTDAVLMLVGVILAVLFFAAIYSLAADEKLMPGLSRAGNLNFDVDVGELIFGVLGGGAAVWAAKTFASRRGPDGSEPRPTEKAPRRPDSDDDDGPATVEETLSDIEAQLSRISKQLKALRARSEDDRSPPAAR